MDNQIAEQLPPEKKISFRNILMILIVVAVSVVAGFIFWDKKPVNNTGTATLSWNTNTEEDLAGYKIYYGTSPRTGDCPPSDYPEKIDIGKTDTPQSPSYTIQNLTLGKTYYFSVTSYDASGNESCFSSEMSKSMPK